MRGSYSFRRPSDTAVEATGPSRAPTTELGPGLREDSRPDPHDAPRCYASAVFRTELLVYGSPDHAAALELRYRVLRQPFGIGALSAAELELEPAAVHWGCFELAAPDQPSRLIGTLLLQTRSPGVIQMRQVAVLPSRQGRGVGRHLVQAAEDWCRAHVRAPALCCLFAHARASALPFYTSLGYRVVDEPFEAVGLPHRRVEKLLS